MIKTCAGCGISRPLSDFSLRSDRPGQPRASCKQCATQKQKDRYASNPEKYIARSADYQRSRPGYASDKAKAYRTAKPEKVKADNQRYYKDNKEKAAADNKQWRSKNAEQRKAYLAEWNIKNADARAALHAKRRAAKLQAIPPWSNQQAIREFYIEAQFLTKVTGDEYQVDHIVPLQSSEVCGLHVPANLRVIPAKLNSAKRNRYWPDGFVEMPEEF